MKPKATSVNSFGTFLETIKKETERAPAEEPAVQDLSQKIIICLDEHPSPVRVRDLISDLSIPVTSTVSILNKLQNLDLVKISLIGADDVAEITPAGRQLARLSR